MVPGTNADGRGIGMASATLSDAARFRARLLAGRPERRGELTAAVRAFAHEYGVSQPSVWRWLGGQAPLPGWLRRELDRAEAAPTST